MKEGGSSDSLLELGSALWLVQGMVQNERGGLAFMNKIKMLHL